MGGGGAFCDQYGPDKNLHYQHDCNVHMAKWDLIVGTLKLM